MSAMNISLGQLSYSPLFSAGNEISTYLFHITERQTSAVEDKLGLPDIHHRKRGHFPLIDHKKRTNQQQSGFPNFG
jgi:hypothetical protein